jgi:type I restriction enzyme S subunit
LQHVTSLGLANSAARLLPRGTVCLSRTASVGYVVKMGREMATSQDFVNWTCGGALDSDYLMRALLAEGEDIRRFGEGSTHTTIYFPEVKAFHIDLPPLAEQRRIVEKVDALTARLARARADLERVPILAARQKQALMYSAFSGELTSEWRVTNSEVSWSSADLVALQTRRAAYVSGRRGSRLRDAPALEMPGERELLPVTWASGCLADTSDLKVGYAFKSDWYSPRGPALLRGANVGTGSVDWSETKRLNPSIAAEYSDYILRAGAIVLAMDRPIISTGLKIAQLVERDDGALLVQRVASPSLTALIDTRYAWWLLNSQFYIAQIERHATGSDLPHVSGNDILTTPTPLPPLAEQREIARLLDAAMAKIDRLENEAAGARALLDRLEAAVLAKAFRGELVPQDPTDEPVSVLLERIRTQRSAAPAVKRGQRFALTAT